MRRDFAVVPGVAAVRDKCSHLVCIPIIGQTRGGSPIGARETRPFVRVTTPVIVRLMIRGSCKAYMVRRVRGRAAGLHGTAVPQRSLSCSKHPRFSKEEMSRPILNKFRYSAKQRGKHPTPSISMTSRSRSREKTEKT